MMGSVGSVVVLKTVMHRYKSKQNKSVSTGKLTVGLTLDNVNERVLAQFWALVLSNFVKTMLASLLMLWLFSRFVTRHLKKITHHVSHNDWLTDAQPLRLDRKRKTNRDDIDQIVLAINSAKDKSVKDYSELANEIKIRRHAEKRLQEKTQILEQANKEQAEFTYAISHDLKSPASTVAMILDELASFHADKLDESGQELIALAKNTNDRMGKLVLDVLHYSQRLDEGIVEEVVDLNNVFINIIQDLQADIQESKAEIIVEPLPQVLGSNSQLSMVFQNLLSNAIKFRADARDPVVRVSSDSAIKDKVCIDICDNGIGIDKKYQEKIFGLFQRLHTHEQYQGSGIGLTLCQRILVNHGGNIRVVSNKGWGTTFVVELRGVYGER